MTGAPSKREQIRRTMLPILMLLLLLAGAVVTTPAEAQEIELFRLRAKPIDVEPGRTASAMLGIRNVSGERKEIQLTAELPPGWFPLIPLPGLVLEPGAEITRLVTIQVPDRALSGRKVLYFHATAGGVRTPEPLHIAVDVAPRVQLDVREIEGSGAMIRAGQPIGMSYVVTNSGNTPVHATLSARSSIGYPVRLQPETVDLEPGGGAEVRVVVDTRSDLQQALTHRSVFTAAAAGVDGSGVTVSTPVELMPAHPVSMQNDMGLPLVVSLLGTAEDGRQAGQVTAELRPTVFGNTVVEGLIRTPDVRRASSFAQRDRYALAISTRNLDARLGDHVYRSSDLLETGRYGFGAEIARRSTDWSAGGYVMRSRHTFPRREQIAGFTEYAATGRLTVGANVLARRSYQESIVGSTIARFRPSPDVEIEGEYALGRADGVALDDASGRTSSAAALRMSGRHERSSWNARFRRIGSDFPGTFRDAQTLSLSVNAVPSERYFVQFDGAGERRFFNGFGGDRVEQTSGFGRGGGGVRLQTGLMRFSGSLYAAARHRRTDFSALRRDERSLEAVGSVTRARSSVRASLRSGVTDDPSLESTESGAVAGRFSVMDLTLSSGVGAWTGSVQASLVDGPTFFNPVDQRRLSGNVAVTWDAGGRTRATAAVYRSVESNFDRRNFTTADVHVSRTFDSGYEMLLRARHVATSFDRSIRDATVGLTLRIPLDVPMPTDTDESTIRGRLVDAETGARMEGAVLTAGVRTATTDASGVFEMDVPPGAGWLVLDRSSIGLDRIPLIDFPVDVNSWNGQEDIREIQVVRSSRLHIDVAPADAADVRIAGILLEARLVREASGLDASRSARTSTLRRRLVGHEGTVSFGDLIPGLWTVRPIASTLPDGFVSAPDSLTVELAPGAESRVTIEIAPRQRTIQIISKGEVSRPVILPDTTAGDATVAERADTDEPAADKPTASDPPGNDQYIVQPGDILSSIARRVYGRSSMWPRIWRANRDVLNSPHGLKPGLKLTVPSGESGLTDEEHDILEAYEDPTASR